jgi:hypothetical protein
MSWSRDPWGSAPYSGITIELAPSPPRGAGTYRARDPWAAAPYAGTVVGLVTDWLYATSAAAVSGSWADTANAVGAGTGDFATWTTDTPSSAALELSGFGAQAAMGTGEPASVEVRVRHNVSPAEHIDALTVQAYVGAVAHGSPIPLYVSDVGQEDTVTISGLDSAALADLRVRVSAAYSAGGYGASPYGRGRYGA